MSLTFLGTSGSVITKRRMCSGILFEDKLIDLGFGVLTNFMRSGKKLDEIEEIYITHTHSDHIGDFTGLIWAMAMENRTRPIRVISSASTAYTLSKILELQSTPPQFVKFNIEFVRPEDAKIKHLITIHDPENLAYRFKSDGGEFVYTGDTAFYESVSQFAKDCDLLIHDATFLGNQESLAKLTNHSTAKDAGRIARDATVGNLVLTHIASANENEEGRYIEESKESFDGHIVVARDNLTITF